MRRRPAGRRPGDRGQRARHPVQRAGHRRTVCSTPGSSPFADLKPMRAKVPGATVNDVALAVIGGALRGYLRRTASCRGVAAGDDPGVGAHRERDRPTSATRCRRWSSAWPPTSPTRSSGWPPCTARRAGRRRSPRRSGRATSPSCPSSRRALLIGLGTRLAGQFARRGSRRRWSTRVVTNVPGPRAAAVLRRRQVGALVRRRSGGRRHGADQHRQARYERAVRPVVHRVP